MPFWICCPAHATPKRAAVAQGFLFVYSVTEAETLYQLGDMIEVRLRTSRVMKFGAHARCRVQRPGHRCVLLSHNRSSSNRVCLPTLRYTRCRSFLHAKPVLSSLARTEGGSCWCRTRRGQTLETGVVLHRRSNAFVLKTGHVRLPSSATSLVCPPPCGLWVVGLGWCFAVCLCSGLGWVSRGSVVPAWIASMERSSDPGVHRVTSRLHGRA